MPLLSRHDLRPVAKLQDSTSEPGVPGIAASGKASFLVGRKGVDLEELIPELQQDQTYHIPSRGQWSLHEMILFLAHRIGPCDICLSSWGITEEPLKQVINSIHSGALRNAMFLLDGRVKLQAASAYQLLIGSGDVVNTRFTKNHSKVVMLTNDQWGVLINSSANLTYNPRLEFYDIATHRQVVLAMRKWFQDEHAKAQPITAQ